MKIRLIAVGKLKEDYLKKGIAEYVKRLQPFAKFEIIEVSDEKAPETMSEQQLRIIIEKEGERIMKSVSPSSYVITLAIDGKQLTSEQFADHFAQLGLTGRSDITFIIGGSNGLAPTVLARADFKLSFGTFTYPHQLMRLILVEQIYRAFKINAGEPYHK